jgi:hypothetical protein
MRTVAEYMTKAAEFDDLARDAKLPGLKKRYLDLADCYRLLAKEREQLVAQGVIPMEPLPSLPPP